MLHVHPECQMDLTFAEKWCLKIISPLIFLAALSVQSCLRYCLYQVASGNFHLKWGHRWPTKKRIKSCLNTCAHRRSRVGFEISTESAMDHNVNNPVAAAGDSWSGNDSGAEQLAQAESGIWFKAKIVKMPNEDPDVPEEYTLEWIDDTLEWSDTQMRQPKENIRHISDAKRNNNDDFQLLDEVEAKTNICIKFYDRHDFTKLGLDFHFMLRDDTIGIYVSAVDVAWDDWRDMHKIEVGQQVFLDEGKEVRSEPYNNERMKKRKAGDWMFQDETGIETLNDLSKLMKNLKQEVAGLKSELRPDHAPRQEAQFSLVLRKPPTRKHMSWYFFVVRVIIQSFFVCVPLIWICLHLAGVETEIVVLLWITMVVLVLEFGLLVHRFVRERGGFKHKLPLWLRRIVSSALSRLLLLFLGPNLWFRHLFSLDNLVSQLESNNVSYIYGDADTLLRHLGQAMVLQLALREISEQLRAQWEKVSESFKLEDKKREIEFFLMGYLQVGYVMLVSAAAQPLSCIRDLDGTLVLSADNTIRCDLCKANAGIAVLGMNITYGVLWVVAALCTLVYSVGVPLFFYYKIWVYAKKDALHTNEYIENYGFLTSKYRNRWWWWEICTLFRKMFMAVISTHSAHRPIRQSLLNLIIVFAAVIAHCYAVPYVNNDANIAEALSLGSTFFVLMIGLGQGSAIDHGLAHSEGHNAVQQTYWFVLAGLCVLSTVFIFTIILKRFRALMHDLNSGHSMHQH